MARSIRVAALQLQAHDLDDFARSLDAILSATNEASAHADLVVLPEATFPAYVLGDTRIDDAAVADALERLGAIARRTRTVIVAGAALRSKTGLRNAAVVIDADGATAGRAEKLFLWHFDRHWFESGERLEPVDTSLGKLGVLVCADGRIPTIARELVDRGAELLVMPTAWVTSGRDPHCLENVQADLLARVRAYENGVPFVAANKCGAEFGMVAYCGKSQAVDANGEIVAIAGQRRPETLTASLTTNARRPFRTTPAQPELRRAARTESTRIAISVDPLPNDVDRRLEILADAHAIAPNENARLAALDRALPTAFVNDAEMLDPAGLVAYRRAGYGLAVWTTRAASPWNEPVARARALELRMYVVVLDCHAMRGYAIDPDGTVVAGTFDGYRMASFALDPRKTVDTAVAPGTDVGEGLERVAALLGREGAFRR